VCLHADGGEPECLLLSEEAGRIRWKGATPRFVYPNGGEVGYWRFSVPREEWLALSRAREQLPAVERAGLIANLWASVRTGSSEPGELLEALAGFDGETERHVVEGLIGVLEGFDRALVEPKSRAAFAKYAGARLAPQLARLGLARKPGESEDDTLLRQKVVGAAVELAQDAAVLRELDKAARAWLERPESVDPELAELAVPLASRAAGPERFDALLRAAQRPGAPAERIVALIALGSLTEAAGLRRALDLALTDAVRPSELFTVIGAAEEFRESRPAVLSWVQERWVQLRQKLPGPMSAHLSFPITFLCDASQIEKLRAEIAPRLMEVPGAQRPLTKAVESAQTCAAVRARWADDASKWLAGH
jgi:alanyl aminopeptidase